MIEKNFIKNSQTNFQQKLIINKMNILLSSYQYHNNNKKYNVVMILVGKKIIGIIDSII